MLVLSTKEIQMAVDPITGATIPSEPSSTEVPEEGEAKTAALINPSPSPFAVPEVVSPTDEEISELVAKGSILTDQISAKDTPASNLKFREELGDDAFKAEANPLPNRVGNELTRLENGAIESIQRLARLNNFMGEIREGLTEEQQKKLDSLTIPSR